MKKIMTLFITIILALTISVSVFAELKAEDIDDNQELSLSVTFSIEEELIEGAEISIYKVAEVYTKGYGVFYTSLVGDIDYEGMTAEESNKAASLLAEEVTDIFASGNTDENGMVSFTDLEKGIYLVVLSKEYYTDDGTQYVFDPYLVRVPLATEEDGMYTWDYDVESSPKTTDYIAPDNTMPQTADVRHIALWVTLATISAAAIVGINRTKKKKKQIYTKAKKNEI